MNTLTKLILTLCVLCVSVATNAKSPYAPKLQSGVIYELYIDFGYDAVFLHEVTKHKWYCDARAKYFNTVEKVNAYCLKRVP